MSEAFFPKNPYVGPRSFRPGEQLYGRDIELRNLFYLLTAERIVLLHSPSGAGKTSLIQAALIDELRKERFRVLPLMRVSTEPPAFTRPLANALADEKHAARPQPNRYLFSAIQALEEGLPEHLRLPEWELLKLSFDSYLSRRPGAAADQDCEVLIFDQFEEIITTDPTDTAGKLRFFDEVGRALRDPRRWALFAIREEYIGPLEPYISRIPTRLAHRFRLDLLSLNAAKAAIRYPARDVQVNFTDTAATRLAENLARVQVQQADGTSAPRLGQYVEPVQLQVVCRQFWSQMAIRREQQLRAAGSELLNILLQAPSPPPITVDDLSAAGDVDQALARYYESQVGAALATGARERAVRDWVEQQLITADGLRSQVLRTPDVTKGLPNATIQALIDGHLIRAEPRLGAIWYELAHDRMIEPIQASNAAWREKHLHTLQKQAELWDQNGHQKGLLLSDDALVEAERWAEANAADLTPRDRDFLRACQHAREQAKAEHRSLLQARQSARRRMFSAVTTGIVAVLVIIFAVMATTNAYTAQSANATAISWQNQAIANARSVQTANAGKNQAENNLQNANRQVSLGQLAQHNANATAAAVQATVAAYGATTVAIQETSEVLKNAKDAAGPTIAALLGDSAAYQEQIYQANVAAANAVSARQTAVAERDQAQAAQASAAAAAADAALAARATVGPAQAQASTAQTSAAVAQAQASAAQATASAAQASAAQEQIARQTAEAAATQAAEQLTAAQQQIVQLQAQLTAVTQPPPGPNGQQAVPDTTVPDPAQSQDTPTQKAP